MTNMGIKLLRKVCIMYFLFLYYLIAIADRSKIFYLNYKQFTMNSDEDCPVTPPKKYKRGSKLFVDDWLTSAEFNGWLENVPDDVTKAKCKACKVHNIK